MINRDIIQRYLAGKATKQDLRQLRSYLGGADLSLLKERMSEDWENLDGDEAGLPPELSREMFRQIRSQIDQSKSRKIKKVNRRQYLAIAASILFLLGAGLWFWWSRPVPQLSYATGYGEWKTLTLPDGSWVKLNANSEIRFAARWKEGADRQVWLDGEAFFDVQKKPESGAKFQVYTKDLRVEVLGTSFNVSSRGLQTDVFLQEGKIRLSMGDQETLLLPGDFLAYSAQKKAVVKRQNAIPAEVHTSWKDGVLIMKDQPVGMILKKLEEIYGVQTSVLDQRLLTHIKTVSVPMDKLEIAISVLERTFGVTITKQENQLVIQ